MSSTIQELRLKYVRYLSQPVFTHLNLNLQADRKLRRTPFRWYVRALYPLSIYDERSDIAVFTYLVLYLFECLVTLGQEVEVIWKSKWSMMASLYASTRYYAVLDTIPDLIPVWGKLVRGQSTASDFRHLLTFLCPSYGRSTYFAVEPRSL